MISGRVTRVNELGHVKRLQLDDYLILLACIPFTVQIVMNSEITVVYRETAVDMMPPENSLQAVHMVPALGKIFAVFEQSRIWTVYLCKGCLLYLDYKLTAKIPLQHLAIKIIIFYVALGFFVTEIFYFFIWCRPFKDMWLSMEG